MKASRKGGVTLRGAGPSVIPFAVALAGTVLVVLSTVCWGAPSDRRASERVVDGEVDLRRWDLEQDGPVRLEGSWEVAEESEERAWPTEEASPNADFVHVPWGDALGSTRSGNKLLDRAWVALRVRIRAPSREAQSAIEFQRSPTEAFHFSCVDEGGHVTRVAGGIDDPQHPERYREAYFAYASVLLKGDASCTMLVPRSSRGRIAMSQPATLVSAREAGISFSRRMLATAVRVSILLSFVVFAGIMWTLNRGDGGARWSLAFALPMLVRAVSVERGVLFDPAINRLADPSTAALWRSLFGFRTEYANLWVFGFAFARYVEEIVERPLPWRKPLFATYAALTVLALSAPYGVNRSILAVGQAALIVTFARAIGELYRDRGTPAVSTALAGVAFAMFGALASIASVALTGAPSFIAETLVIAEPFFQMAVLGIRATHARSRSAAIARATQRFVPMPFLRALGHADVTTAQLGDASLRETSVLFADIRDFTTRCEDMSPAETFAFVNGCLSRIGPRVREHHGFVDKYIGDAVMALFPREPGDAVRAAMAIQAEVRASNARHPERATLAVGIGVHVGSVMMGMIGEPERLEATVISDVVNTAARLESLTKHLGCSVLISDTTYEALPDDLRVWTRSLGRFVVKGKSVPIEMFEVFSEDAANLRESKRENAASFAAMLAAVANDRIEDALLEAGELRDLCPEDGPLNWWFLLLLRASTSSADADTIRGGVVTLLTK